MSKLNTEGRLAAYELCQKRDGHICKRCRKGPKTVGPLKVDHIDNDPHNNPKNGKNWQLLCHACNIKKNPRGPGKRGIRLRHKLLYLGREEQSKNEGQGASESADLRVRVLSAEMKKNVECEWRFREWLIETLTELQVMARSDATDGGAEHLTRLGYSITQQTTDRYLQKMTSFVGQVEVFTGEDGRRYIRLKAAKGNDPPQLQESVQPAQ